MHKAKERKLERQEKFLKGYAQYPTIEAACKQTGITESTFNRWKQEPAFRQSYDELAKKKKAEQRRQRLASKAGYGLVFDDEREVPDKGTFTEWRRKYIGRAVEDHQVELVQAYEDKSNLVIISLMPPSAGKDTTAGDFLLYELCDNRDLRAAWVMRGESFARRRVAERLDPYLTDERTYRNAPPGKTSTVPTGNLIEDYGPFKFKKGMVDRNGDNVAPTTWTKNEIYFLKTGAPEADPNMWATGMEGQMYGSRVDLMVMSDVFDRENQLQLSSRESQYGWVMGTAMSRLDESGRLVILGTRCLPGDNYERLIEAFVGEAAVVYQGKHYTKYANGVAVIIQPAVEVNADGEEESYWSGRFPMTSKFRLPDKTEIEADTADEKELALQYGGMVQRIRGLKEIRARDRVLFETMYQQAPPEQVTGDFTDETLNHADDETRTYGVYKPNELVVVGADPARTGGAAWVAWGVNRDKGTISVIDYFFGSKLGITGLKSKLVVEPIARYRPVWFAYETNREAAVLDDSEIKQVFKDFGTSVHTHHTSWANRPSGTIGVPSLSFYMRSGVIRWPAMTAEDRERTLLIKEHFKTWDRKEALGTHRAHLKGQPDDIAMAAWVGFVKAVELLEKGRRAGPGRQAMPVPQSVQRKWDRMQERSREKQYIRDKEGSTPFSLKDVISIVAGGE